MTIEELKKKMIEAETELDGNDNEELHALHDDLLLEYINDKEVTNIFQRTTKWYA